MMGFLLGLLGLFGVLIISTYFLNKLSNRKANSFNTDTNNNLSQFQENNRQNETPN